MIIYKKPETYLNQLEPGGFQLSQKPDWLAGWLKTLCTKKILIETQDKARQDTRQARQTYDYL